MSTEIQNPYLDYLIDPSFHRVNKRFVLSFEDNAFQTRHTRYFLPNVEIKDYNAKIDGQNHLFGQPAKNDLRTYDNIPEMKLVKERITRLVVY